jgi:lipopolysaccharide/colanic/teichoic acid biosynthesis glycosyltransferase
VLPGITGWAQVNRDYGQNLDDVREKLHLDLEYVSRRSAWEDFKIMVLTVPVMLFKKGAW